MKHKLLNNCTAEINLIAGEFVKVFEPNSIILFEGDPERRKEEFVNIATDLKAVFSKKKIIVSTIQGPSSFVVSLPRGCFINIFEVNGDDSFLYNFKNLLFCTNGITYRSQILLKNKLSMALATKSLVATSFSGNGHIAILSDAELFQRNISNTAVYINVNNIISIPKSADVQVTYYGDNLSSQTMEMHYLIKGTKRSGEYILFQGANIGIAQEQQQNTNADSLPKRIVKKYVPGADIILK
jgi:uncharacterized protein (AIM24 family)